MSHSNVIQLQWATQPMSCATETLFPPWLSPMHHPILSLNFQIGHQAHLLYVQKLPLHELSPFVQEISRNDGWSHNIISRRPANHLAYKMKQYMFSDELSVSINKLHKSISCIVLRNEHRQQVYKCQSRSQICMRQESIYNFPLGVVLLRVARIFIMKTCHEFISVI